MGCRILGLRAKVLRLGVGVFRGSGFESFGV